MRAADSRQGTGSRILRLAVSTLARCIPNNVFFLSVMHSRQLADEASSMPCFEVLSS